MSPSFELADPTMRSSAAPVWPSRSSTSESSRRRRSPVEANEETEASAPCSTASRNAPLEASNSCVRRVTRPLSASDDRWVVESATTRSVEVDFRARSSAVRAGRRSRPKTGWWRIPSPRAACGSIFRARSSAARAGRRSRPKTGWWRIPSPRAACGSIFRARSSAARAGCRLRPSIGSRSFRRRSATWKPTFLFPGQGAPEGRESLPTICGLPNRRRSVSSRSIFRFPGSSERQGRRSPRTTGSSPTRSPRAASRSKSSSSRVKRAIRALMASEDLVAAESATVWNMKVDFSASWVKRPRRLLMAS